MRHSRHRPDTLLEAIETFTKDVSKWNRNSFGNLFHQKKHLLARLDGIQSSPNYPTSRFLQNLENIVLKEYNVVLHLEEEFWELKSRIHWLQYGDSNAKFFHLSTLQRRRRNRISALKDNTDNWCFDAQQIQSSIFNYYNNLFTIELPHSPRYSFNYTYRCLTLDDYSSLLQLLIDHEVLLAVKPFKPFKASGPDDLHPYFYQHFWTDIGPKELTFCKHVSSNFEIPASINKTYICLIPKV